MNEPIKGQFTLLGYATAKKRRPCEYGFNRYIGQKVSDSHGIHIIKDIEEYYTIFEDGTVGTPHDMSPVNQIEYEEMLEKEIEYNQYLKNSTCRTNKTIAEGNLKILEEIKRKMSVRGAKKE